MSFKTFFSFSSGLAHPITVPHGTLQSCLTHVERIECTLGLKREQYKDNPVRWQWQRRFEGIDDKVLCQTVEHHNQWVQSFWYLLENSATEPAKDGEELTPEQTATFWHGLELLKVSPDRWTGDYYRARMDELYEVMRGREAAGMIFDAKALTPKQAAAVVQIFDQYLDPGDYRLNVPHGRDYLASSYDGGYCWCDTCFRPIAEDDHAYCRRKKCSMREEFGE